MVWTKEKSAAILRQLRDITEDVELLDHGVCDLEAKQLMIVNNPGLIKELRSEVNYLTAMNNSTSDYIQKSLREVEDIVRTEMGSAPEANSKELVQEFLKVLKSSIRVLQDHRMVQHAYMDEMNKRLSQLDSSILLEEGEKKLDLNDISVGGTPKFPKKHINGRKLSALNPFTWIFKCSCMN